MRSLCHAFLFLIVCLGTLWGQNVEIEGYGEFFGFSYPHAKSGGMGRLIIAPCINVSPNVKLYSQVGFEHPAENGRWHEGELEVLALDFHQELGGLSFGKVHVPVGLYNLYHEPIYFLTVEPSRVEHLVIPAEWHETAALAYYQQDQLSITGGIMSPMDARRWSVQRGFVREKRLICVMGGGVATLVRVEYGTIENKMIGGSFVSTPLVGSLAKAHVAEAHMTMRQDRGWEVLALISQGWIENHASLRGVNAIPPSSRAMGASLTLGYDVGQWIGFSSRKVVGFFHSEYAQPSIPLVSSGLGGQATGMGINYFLTPSIVAKGEFRSSSLEGERIALGIGFVY